MTTIWHVELMSDLEPPKWRSGKPGAWRVEKNLSIHLPDKTFEGLEGDCYCFTCRHLIVSWGFFWDGSTGVADTEACAMPSLFHDIVCGALIQGDLSWWKKWRLRRKADKWYAVASKFRGMWGLRAKIRFWGLRLCSPVYRLWQKILGGKS